MVSGLGLARLAYSGNSLASCLSMASSLRSRSAIDGADRLRRLRIGRANCGQQALVFALAAADQVLPIAHNLRKRPRALGEAHRHLRERIGRTGLQRPLRQLEAFLARLGISAVGAVYGTG